MQSSKLLDSTGVQPEQSSTEQQSEPASPPVPAWLAGVLQDVARRRSIGAMREGTGSHRANPHHKAFTKKYADGRKAVHSVGPSKFMPPQMSEKAAERAYRKAQDRIDILHAVVVENERKRFYEQVEGQGKAQAAEAWLAGQMAEREAQKKAKAGN